MRGLKATPALLRQVHRVSTAYWNMHDSRNRINTEVEQIARALKCRITTARRLLRAMRQRERYVD